MAKKFILKQAVLFTTLFALSGGTTFYLLMSSSQGNSNEQDHGQYDDGYVDVPLTPCEKLFNSLTTLQTADFEASIDFTDANSLTNINMNINGSLDMNYQGSGQAQLQEEPILKAVADVKANVDGILLESGLTYFKDTAYLDYNNSRLSLKAEDLKNFVDIFMGMGIKMEIPEEFLSIDVNALMAELNNMEVTPDMSTKDGGYLFKLDVIKAGTAEDGHEIKPLSVFFKSDKDYNFTGIQTNKIYYGNLFLSADVKVNCVDPELIKINKSINPEEYQSFKPALNVVSTIFDIFGKEEHTFGLNVNLNSVEKAPANEQENAPMIETIKEYLKLTGDLTIDRSKNVGLDLNLNEPAIKPERNHKMGLYLFENTAYLNYADFNKMSIANSTIENVVDYLLQFVNREDFEKLLNSLMSSMTGMDMNTILENLNNINALIKGINVTTDPSGKDIFQVTIAPSALGLSVQDIVIDLSSHPESETSLNKILGLHLHEIKFGAMSFDLDIVTKPFKGVNVGDTSSYIAMDKAANIVPGIKNLIESNEFRVILDGGLVSTDSKNGQPIEGKQPLTVDLNGDVQAKLTAQEPLENPDGTKINQMPLIDVYGFMNVKDMDSFNHNFKLDYDKKGDVRLSYNDTLNGKMTKGGVDELIATVTKVIQTPDPHIQELLKDILNVMGETPIGAALMKKDIGALFACKAISIKEVTETTLTVNIDMKLIGMEGNFDLKINYGFQDGIKSIQLANLKIVKETAGASALETITTTSDVHLDINLDRFDAQRETTRLDDSMPNTISLDSLPTALDILVNTTRYNGFKMNANVNLNAVWGLINIDIPLKANVQNNSGLVDAYFKVDDVPVVPGLCPHPELETLKAKKNRVRNLEAYLDNTDDIYLDRVDKAEAKTFTWDILNPTIDEYTIHSNKRVKANTFFDGDNALNFLLRDALGFDDKIMNQILGEGGESQTPDPTTKYQIPYHKIIKNFQFFEDGKDNRFNLVIDLKALTGQSMFGDLNLLLHENMSKVTTGQPRMLSKIELSLGILGGVVKVKLNASLDEFHSVGIDMSNLDNFVALHSQDELNKMVYTTTKRNIQ